MLCIAQRSWCKTTCPSPSCKPPNTSCGQVLRAGSALPKTAHQSEIPASEVSLVGQRRWACSDGAGPTPLTDGRTTLKCQCSVLQPCKSRSWALPMATPHGNPPLPNPPPHLLVANPSPARIVLKDQEKQTQILHFWMISPQETTTSSSWKATVVQKHQRPFNLIALVANAESSVL